MGERGRPASPAAAERPGEQRREEQEWARNFLGSVDCPDPNGAVPDSDPSTGPVAVRAVVPGRRGARCGRCVLSDDVAESAGHLVWIDCEMTGLDIVKDKLIEVAVVVTDSELNVLDPGLDLIISADDADLDGMNEVVVEMHRKSGSPTPSGPRP